MMKHKKEIRLPEEHYAGSFTIEAAVLIPLFVFLMLAVLWKLVDLGEQAAADCVSSRLLLSVGNSDEEGYASRQEEALNNWWFCRTPRAEMIRTDHFLYYTDTVEVSYLPRFTGGQGIRTQSAEHMIRSAVFRNRVDFIWEMADRIPAVRELSNTIKERLADLKERMTGGIP